MIAAIKRWLGYGKPRCLTSTELLVHRVLMLREERLRAGDFGPWDVACSPLLSWTLYTPYAPYARAFPCQGVALTKGRIEMTEGIGIVFIDVRLRGDEIELRKVPAEW